MTDDPDDRALDDLDDVIRRLAPHLTGVDGALSSSWALVLETVDPDGESAIDLLATPGTLESRTLGSLRFAEIILERQILDG